MTKSTDTVKYYPVLDARKAFEIPTHVAVRLRAAGTIWPDPARSGYKPNPQVHHDVERYKVS